MSTHSELTEKNRKIVEGMYEAATKGNFQAVLDCMDKDVVVYEPSYLPYGGVFNGIDGFQKLFASIAQFADVGKVKVNYSVADGDRVIGYLSIPDKKTGKDLLLLEQSTLKNGKVVEMRVCYFDAGSMIGAPKISA